MLPQLAARNEALPTVRADVRLLPSVGPGVRNKVRLLIETFAAGGALVRPLSGMSPFMYHQMPGLTESFSAVWTFIRLLPLVGPLVDH